MSSSSKAEPPDQCPETNFREFSQSESARLAISNSQRAEILVRESFGWFLFSVDFREFSKVEENHVGIFAVFLRGRILRHHLMDHGQPVADTHEQSE